MTHEFSGLAKCPLCQQANGTAACAEYRRVFGYQVARQRRELAAERADRSRAWGRGTQMLVQLTALFVLLTFFVLNISGCRFVVFVDGVRHEVDVHPRPNQR